MGAIDWGDAPTWAGAIFAAAAAVGAIWTLKSQRDQIDEQRRFIAEQSENLSLEREQLRAIAKERKWAQALRVRMKHSRLGPASTGQLGDQANEYRWRVVLWNSSDKPLRNVTVRFGDSYTAQTAHEVDETNVYPSGEPLGVPVDLIGPAVTFEFSSPRMPRPKFDRSRPHAYFTDAADAQWHLDERGKLEEVRAGSLG
ncbi:hypothetical protein OHB14_38715 [Streptomyces sp. NBC_01613]|uniref:hypothetical protein n=1 Tax=Streptomyces sp. NBC_01613 TaxID=2975896 RepID=UPI0038634167